MTKEQAIQIWEPILTNMDYKGNKLGDICLYATRHTAIDKIKGGNFLPVSIKCLVLIKSLDLPNVTFTSEDDDNITKAINRNGLLNSILTDDTYEPIKNEYIIELPTSKDSILALSESHQAKSGTNIAGMIENELVNLAAKKINNDIISFGNEEITLNASRLIRSIDIVESQFGDITMSLSLCYTINKNK